MESNINKIINALLGLELNNGIQPSELADSLYDNNYSELDIKKTETSIIATIKFTEDFDGTSQYCTMRYHYGTDRKLYLIEEKLGKSNFKKSWCRDDVIKKYINELKNIASAECIDIQKFVSTIPKKYRSSSFLKLLKEVA